MSEQREALAEALYVAFEWSGCDGSRWDLRFEETREKWRQNADALLASPALARLLADAEQRGAARVTAAVESAVDPGELDCGRLGFTCREAFSKEPERWCRACRLRAALTPAAAQDPA